VTAGRVTTTDELTRKATMMSRAFYHTPPKPVTTRVHCPVCHETVYSRADIHPQCAVQELESQMPKGQALGVVNQAIEDEQATSPFGRD
jgi:hypothetical protein